MKMQNAYEMIMVHIFDFDERRQQINYYYFIIKKFESVVRAIIFSVSRDLFSPVILHTRVNQSRNKKRSK